MTWIEHHSLVVGMAVFALAYLNSLVTFPVSTARMTGLSRTTPPLHREPKSPERGRADDFAGAPEITFTPLAQEHAT